jgi:hypothetical protein
MRDAMVELRLVWIRLGVGLGNAFSNHLGIALLMASISAIRTLHTGSVLEEIATEGASHDIVELLLHKLVAILLIYILFPLANGSFAAKSKVEGLLVFVVLDERYHQAYSPDRFQ